MDSLVRDARADGWSSAIFDPRALERWLTRSGWTVAPNRRGGPSVDTLRPTAGAAAQPRSLSALTGHGAQPLHTDGAHHRTPPDLILLYAPRPSAVSTVLWTGDITWSAGGLGEDLRHGLFVVAPGDGTFLAPALDQGALRFDPACMRPADARARRVARFFSQQRQNVIEHQWSTPHLALLIDNHRTLHARNDATIEPDRTLHRIALRAPRKAP